MQLNPNPNTNPPFFVHGYFLTNKSTSVVTDYRTAVFLISVCFW